MIRVPRTLRPNRTYRNWDRIVEAFIPGYRVSVHETLPVLPGAAVGSAAPCPRAVARRGSFSFLLLPTEIGYRDFGNSSPHTITLELSRFDLSLRARSANRERIKFKRIRSEATLESANPIVGKGPSEILRKSSSSA